MRRHVTVIRPGCVLHYHDTKSAYSNGCRCPKAREAWRLYYKRLREHRNIPQHVPSVGVIRRIEALAAFGWPISEQKRRLGVRLNMGNIRNQSVVLRSTAERVDALYRELSMTPGPSQWSRTYARDRGWVPPLCWDESTIDDPDVKPVGMPTYLDHVVPHDRLDEVVVELAVTGRRPVMSTTEKTVAVERLTARGLSAAEVAERLGIAQRSVVRFRRQGVEMREAS